MGAGRRAGDEAVAIGSLGGGRKGAGSGATGGGCCRAGALRSGPGQVIRIRPIVMDVIGSVWGLRPGRDGSGASGGPGRIGCGRGWNGLWDEVGPADQAHARSAVRGLQRVSPVGRVFGAGLAACDRQGAAQGPCVTMSSATPAATATPRTAIRGVCRTRRSQPQRPAMASDGRAGLARSGIVILPKPNGT